MFTRILKSSYDHTILRKTQGWEIAAIYGVLGAGALLAPFGEDSWRNFL